MDSLKLLLEIQKGRKEIKNYNNIVKDTSYIGKLKELKLEFEKSKENFKEKIHEIEKVKADYNEASEKSSVIKKELDDLKNKLYNYTGCDLKSINATQKEISSKEDNLKALDDKLFRLLEIEEELDSSLEKYKNKLYEIKNNFYNYKNEANKRIAHAKDAILKNTKSIGQMENALPKGLLEEFNKIFSLTGSGAGELDKQICSACRMKISSLTLDSIKKGEKIVYCDNCGRIIYYNDEK